VQSKETNQIIHSTTVIISQKFRTGKQNHELEKLKCYNYVSYQEEVQFVTKAVK
jgi:hypothetical protein